MMATAPTSNATSAISVTATTPASTFSRSWVPSSRLSSACPPGAALGRTGTGLASTGAGHAGRAGLAGARQAQAVADGALGVDQVRPVAHQLAAQVGDVGRDDRAGPAEVVVPHVVEEL